MDKIDNAAPFDEVEFGKLKLTASARYKQFKETHKELIEAARYLYREGNKDVVGPARKLVKEHEAYEESLKKFFGAVEKVADYSIKPLI